MKCVMCKKEAGKEYIKDMWGNIYCFDCHDIIIKLKENGYRDC